jgi:hypothetical protein
MRKIFDRLPLLAACALAAFLTGCGGDTAGQSDNSSNNNNNNSNPPPTTTVSSPASIGDNTIHGTFQSPHDPTQTVHWHLTTSGTTTGSYTYEEENFPNNTGTYTWTKTGDTTAALTTSNNGTIQFNYTGARSGTYVFARPGYEEDGTFTTDN